MQQPLLHAHQHHQLGSTLADTEKLQKRHVQAEQELFARQPLLLATIQLTKQLIERNHYARAQLAQRLAELEASWQSLRELTERRGRQLEEALAAQKFYGEATDLLDWLREKRPQLASQDYGEDDLASLSFLKQLAVLMTDLGMWSERGQWWRDAYTVTNKSVLGF